MIANLKLSEFQGKLIENEPLARHTWLGVGGKALLWAEPVNLDDLIYLFQKTTGISKVILGAGSNILIRDGGIDGIVVCLKNTFKQITVENSKIVCGAGVMLNKLATVAADNSITGFEFMEGIPGTVGGAFRTNAGAHGNCLKDRLRSVTVVTPAGTVQEITAVEELLGYRSCSLPTDFVVTELTLSGEKGVKEGILSTMQTYKEKRLSAQPTGVRTAGSTFKNPEGAAAWKLIDLAGFRGYRHGGAMVSEKHTNFLINTGTATASDLEELGELIREKVKKETGYALEWEVQRWGKV